MSEEVIFYTTGCPKCAVLKKKMDQKHIFYKSVSSMDEMLKAGLKSAPALRVDGALMGYSDAIQWINGIETDKE